MSSLKRHPSSSMDVDDVDDVDDKDGDDDDDDDVDDYDSTGPAPFVCLPVFGEHKRAVSAVSLAPSKLTKPQSALCASASADGSVKIWDLGPTGGDSLSMMLDTNTYSSNNNSNNNHNNHTSLQPVATLVGHTRGINDVCWSASGGGGAGAAAVDPFVATASDDKTLRIFDAQTSDSLVDFRGHDNFVFCCQFNPASSNLLVSGSFDETVKLWDVRSGQCVTTLPAHSDPVTAVSFNRDGTCVVSASHDGLIRIWDVATGQCLKTIFASGNPPVSHVTYSPNGKFVLASTLDGALRLWPVSVSGRHRCAKTYVSEPHRINTKYCIVSKFLVPSSSTSSSSSPPRRRRPPCIVTGSETGDVLLFDVQTRKVQQVLPKVHQDVVLAVDAHDDMDLIASGGMSQDRTVRFWVPSSSSSSKTKVGGGGRNKRPRND